MIPQVDRHTVYVYDRGGRRRLRSGQIQNIEEVTYSRVRDEISEATVKLHAQSAGDQRDLLLGIEPGRHELVIFRGDERMWEGPITLIDEQTTSVTIHAKDVMHYAARTVMHASYDSRYPKIETVVKRAERVLRGEMSRKEAMGYNVLAHLQPINYSTDAQTSRLTEKFEMTVYEHLDDMASKGGMDYTVLGRRILLWDTSRPLGQTPTVTQKDFLAGIAVGVYGMELATRTIVTDGEGRAGIAGSTDPYYGEVELLATAYDEDTAEKDEAPPTQAELTSQAKRNLAGRNPTPIQVRVPENSGINPKGVLELKHLVPGIFIPLRAKTAIRDIDQMQKLNKVTFTETSKGESITLSMGPATQSDDTGEEEAA